MMSNMTAVARKTKTVVKDIVDAVQEKTARINVRVSVRQRELIQEAAELTGTTMSEFILVPAVERAAQVLASEHVTRLNAEVAERFAAWMDEPAQVIHAMKRLVEAEPLDD
jgi:uncharacterized protein (DUF1778 family)